jgi:hypothetical protein
MLVAMYVALLSLHSWLRWAVLSSTLTCAVLATRKLRGTHPWSDGATRLARAWVSLIDLQALAGMTLYFACSPVAEAARTSPSSALRDPSLRFFGLLHPLGMALVFVLTHATWIAVRRSRGARIRYRRWAIGASSSLVILALAVPWPQASYGRPLFRSTTPLFGGAP